MYNFPKLLDFQVSDVIILKLGQNGIRVEKSPPNIMLTTLFKIEQF